MSFIDQAKEVLTSEQVTRLELLAMKSASFDSSNEEIDEMKALKQEVVKLIASRDRQKNLSFLKDGAYDIKDILEVMGKDHHAVIKDSGLNIRDIFKLLNITKKEAMSAVKEVYVGGGSSEVKEGGYNGVLAVYGSEDVNFPNSTREANKLVVAGGEKTFVENLTDSGKEWIIQSYLSEKGPYKGQQIYGNINKVATKWKLNKEALKKELGLIKVEEKKEEPKKDLGAAATPAPTKKQEAKKAA